MSNSDKPAFPFSALTPNGPTVYKDNEGMTLREYYAGQAATGLGNIMGIDVRILAARCVRLADELIAELERER
jgi:hypothetical protein